MLDALSTINTFMTTHPVGQAIALTAFGFLFVMHFYCYYAGYRDLLRWTEKLRDRAGKLDERV